MTRELRPYNPILVVDDEEAILLSIDTILRLAGMNNVITCADSRQAVAIIKQRTPSVILLDLNMPHLKGEAIIDIITTDFPHIPIIIITGRIDAETAVACMKSGVADYIVKPVNEEKLITSVKQSLESSQTYLDEQATAGRLAGSGLRQPAVFQHIITKCPKMFSIFHYIESITVTDLPVLIHGESGTGKELIAQAIHQASGKTGEFVAVNVAGLDESVFADTLFGHARGAFTSADFNRKGLVEQAAEGTLFLDEIGDLAPGSQVKLLRLLQESEYMPLGQDGMSTSTARVITSTHVDLWDLQQKGLFRLDLHYRLRTHRIEIPPLRERKEDLPLLIDHFLQTAADAYKKTKPNLPAELIPLLETYHFPGNIRELQAMVFDALAQHKNGTLSLSVFRDHIAQTRATEAKLQETTIESAAIPFAFADPLPNIKQVTRVLVEEAMSRAGNNQSLAASMLGISQQALSKRLKTWSQHT